MILPYSESFFVDYNLTSDDILRMCMDCLEAHSCNYHFIGADKKFYVLLCFDCALKNLINWTKP